ncbi:hypothetical protein ST44_07725 [Prevotella pectinovora]|uniref:Uncharacterized protein n=1 Tax=Prevotella pectinovora TaxID=1602169 RepID=A0A0D0ITF4_9BACT|nr:hypothetical protein ST44_07725 [Prevotella pectinovora]
MAAVADVGRREVKIWRTRQLVWTSAHQQQAAVMKSFLPLLPELFFFMLPEVFLSQTGHWNLSGFCFFRIVDYCPSNVMFWAQFGVRNLPTWGNVLAPSEKAACPTWARCLPISCSFC